MCDTVADTENNDNAPEYLRLPGTALRIVIGNREYIYMSQEVALQFLERVYRTYYEGRTAEEVQGILAFDFASMVNRRQEIV